MPRTLVLVSSFQVNPGHRLLGRHVWLGQGLSARGKFLLRRNHPACCSNWSSPTAEEEKPVSGGLSYGREPSAGMLMKQVLMWAETYKVSLVPKYIPLVRNVVTDQMLGKPPENLRMSYEGTTMGLSSSFS